MTKYFKSKWLLMFLLIPFFKPICFQYYTKLGILENLFVVWKMVSAFISVGLLVIYILNCSRLSKLVIWTFLFEMSIVFSTVINQGYLIRSMIDAVSIISYVALLSLFIKYNKDALVRLLSILMGILMLINLGTMLLFPGGLPADLYTNSENALYFMVTDNGSALFLSFCVLLFVIEDFPKLHRISKKNKLFVACCFFSAILSHSATAIFSVTLLILSIIFICRSNITKIVNPVILVLIFILSFIYLMAMPDNAVSQFVQVYIFRRTSNFSGRYELWKTAINMIKMRPWIGYGRIAHDYIPAWGGYFSSHNYILELLLQGGLLAFVLYAVINFVSLKRVYPKHYGKVTNCLVFTLWVMMTAALMESAVHSVYIFGVISLCYHCRYLEFEKEEKVKVE